VASLPLTVAAAWALAGLLHWWPRLPSLWRRRLSLASSVVGLAFLVAAIRSEGLRESATTSLVLIAPARLTWTASASASLYYYVLTGVSLFLGFAGLVAGEPLARWLSRRCVLGAVAVAWLVTLVRILLEKSAAPVPLVHSVGVTAMAPGAGAYLATCLRLGGGGAGLGALIRPLVAYAFAVRALVALVGAVVTRAGLGTHYDVSGFTSVPLAFAGTTYAFAPGSWRQIVWLVALPQLVLWPLYTVVAGMLGGGLARLLAQSQPRPAPHGSLRVRDGH
jgi:hypothetical protein